MSQVKRTQVQEAVLAWMYSKLLQSPSMWAMPGEHDIDGFGWAEVQYELRRLEGDGYIRGNHLKRITARGIDLLQDLAGGTIVDGDLRERLLEALYEMDRDQGPYARANTESIAAVLGAAPSDVGAVLHYLEDAGLVDVQGTMSDRFYRVGINARGMAKHEAIEAAGGGWATSTTSPSDGHEFIFGPNEESEAARLLRDVTEVARTEIVIVDPYARAGIVEKLKHAPKGVTIKILTSDQMASEKYAAELQLYTHIGLEIRTLPKADLEFHDRYIIVDGDDAWAWGHSFHDAGKTKHTVAQIRPVNRDRILAEFQKRWPTGTVVT